MTSQELIAIAYAGYPDQLMRIQNKVEEARREYQEGLEDDDIERDDADDGKYPSNGMMPHAPFEP